MTELRGCCAIGERSTGHDGRRRSLSGASRLRRVRIGSDVEANSGEFRDEPLRSGADAG